MSLCDITLSNKMLVVWTGITLRVNSLGPLIDTMAYTLLSPMDWLPLVLIFLEDGVYNKQESGVKRRVVVGRKIRTKEKNCNL